MSETFACPHCGTSCEANFVDIGVGEQRVEPWHCPACHWTEPSLDLFIDEDFDPSRDM